VLAYQEWIIDSGATHHICHSRSSFYYLARLPESIRIILGDSSEIFAYESGNIRFNLSSECSIDIRAIYVPSFSMSLLSIGQLSSQYSITFTEMTCSIIRPSADSANQQIELATFTNGLYRMKAEGSSQTATRAESFAAISTAKPTLVLWHQRFGHIGRNSLQVALGKSLPKSKDSALVPTCEPCILGKQHQNVIHTPVPPVSCSFELIHSDVCGPIAVPSFLGQKYFGVYIDDYSRRVWVYFVRSKDSLEMTSVFQEFVARMDKAYSKWPIARFRCDNGRGEYDNRLFRGILPVSGISFEPAPPYTQHKNGKSEQMIQTLVTMSRTLLIDAKLPTAMWAEPIMTSSYLHEWSASRLLNHKSPYTMLNDGKKPVIHHLRRFGYLAYKLIPPPQRINRKFGERSCLCIMIGYVHDATTLWRLWDRVEKRMITASNVIFDEGKIVGNASFDDVLKATLPEEVYSDEEDEDTVPVDCTPKIVEVDKDRPSEIPTSEASIGEPPAENFAETAKLLEQSNVEHSPAQKERPEEKRESDQGSELSLPRSNRIQANAGLTDASSSLKTNALTYVVDTLHDRREPVCYSEAASDGRWQEGMRSEYSSLKAHGTFTHVKSYDRKPITCKWVFRIKRNADGSNRYKARLVARGFEQVPGLDYGETFAPVARLTTFQIYVVQALARHATIYHLDVITTFLNPKIDKHTAIAIAEGSEWLDPQLAQDLTPVSVLGLNKALYGQKQAP